MHAQVPAPAVSTARSPGRSGPRAAGDAKSVPHPGTDGLGAGLPGQPGINPTGMPVQPGESHTMPNKRQLLSKYRTMATAQIAKKVIPLPLSTTPLRFSTPPVDMHKH